MGGVRWYPGKRAKLARDVQASVNAAAQAIADDLQSSGTMPYAVDERGAEPGALQASVAVEPAAGKSRKAHVTTAAPYARRLYYHPEYNFEQGANNKAQGFWYGQYMRKGAKKRLAKDAFAREMRARRG